MLSFNFFDSNEWEVVSNEAMKDKIKALEADNDFLRNLNENITTKIDNQRKEITHLLKAQEKLKAEIVNKEQIISSLDANCNMLKKKIGELNEGISNSDDITWKDKYEALKISSNQAIDALQKKCINIKYGVTSESRISDSYISKLENKVKELKDLHSVAIWKKEYIISYLENRVNNLEKENDKLRDIINRNE